MITLAVALALATPADVLKEDVDTIAREMTLPGMRVDLVWTECGQTNAFYVPMFQMVVMCDELLTEDPGFVRFVAAHEMAHAIMFQLDVPYTGSQEDAADELAGVVLPPDDVLAAGLWWAQREDHYDPTDDHSFASKRAYTLVCLADGAEERPVSLYCSYRYKRAVRAWARLLGA